MIVIDSVDKTYHLKGNDVEALKNVSLTIEDGTIYGVIGYSGAGKSTLVRCINLLEVPDSGSITVNGTQLTWHDSEGNFHRKTNHEMKKVRRGIGMIFQHFNLLDRSTVFDNVAYPLKYNGLKKEEIDARVTELLELVDLSDKRNVYPSQLSGGQKQRVAIARALANNPKVLLSDEATSALDPEATTSILNLLKELNKKLGFFISTLITAVIWWLWHLPLFFIPGASQYQANFYVFGIMVLGFSFMLSTIRSITGSVWLGVLCHAIINSVGNFYHYDLYGSYLASGITAGVMIVVSAILVYLFRNKNI